MLVTYHTIAHHPNIHGKLQCPQFRVLMSSDNYHLSLNTPHVCTHTHRANRKWHVIAVRYNNDIIYW